MAFSIWLSATREKLIVTYDYIAYPAFLASVFAYTPVSAIITDMALVIVDGNKREFRPAAWAAYLWRVWTGEVKTTDKAWNRYAARTRAVYLNPYNPTTPRSYLEKHPPTATDRPVTIPSEPWLTPGMVETRKDLA